MKINITYNSSTFLSKIKLFSAFVCLLFSINFIFAQKINDAEYKYFIQKQVKNPTLQAELQKIHENIILGKYDKSLELIKKYRNRKDISPAIRTYLSNIEYVKGNYAVSVSLCDSVINELKTSLKNPYLTRAMYYKAKAVSALGDNKLAVDLADRAIQNSEEMADKYMLASGYYYKGVFYAETGKFTESIASLIKSKAICEDIGDKINLAATQSFLGLSYSHTGKYAEAIDIINESILIRLEIGDKRGLANSYLNMNKVYTELDDNEKRLEYENKSLAICQEIDDQQCISGRLTNIGDIYYLEGNYTKAISYQEKALRIAKKLKIKYRVAEIHFHFAQIFTAQKNFLKAKAHIDTCFQLRKESQNNEGLATALVLKAQILMGQKSLMEAQVTAEDALEIAQKFNLIHVKRDAHKILGDIFEKKGDFSNAFFHLKEFQLLKDSLFNIEKSKVFIRKELEKKYQLTELDNKKKQALKEIELRNQKERLNQLIWIGVLVIISLAIVVYLIYNKYQSQRKINSIVTQNQELNSQIVNLEKQAIFSQTIATVAHELNTPLGVIHAGNNERQILFNKLLESNKRTFPKNDFDFIEFVLSKSKFFEKNKSGLQKRRQAQKIFDFLTSSTKWESEQQSTCSILMSQWELNNEQLNEILDKLVINNINSETILFTDSIIRNQELSKALETSIFSAREVVKELNDLSINQLSTFNQIEFAIVDILRKIIEIKGYNSISNLSIEIKVNQSQSLFLDEKLFFQTASLIIQNMVEALSENVSNARIWIDFESNNEYDELRFSNNGEKIHEGILPQIFDRFFTTKNKEQHRGLGLSIVKNNMESFGGKVLVSSTEKETKFTLCFKKPQTNNKIDLLKDSLTTN
jgi:signal transduction histidine kinase